VCVCVLVRVFIPAVSKTFDFNHGSTIGVEFQTKTVQIDGATVTAHLWDTAGACVPVGRNVVCEALAS
jgi:Ras family